MKAEVGRQEAEGHVCDGDSTFMHEPEFHKSIKASCPLPVCDKIGGNAPHPKNKIL